MVVEKVMASKQLDHSTHVCPWEEKKVFCHLAVNPGHNHPGLMAVAAAIRSHSRLPLLLPFVFKEG
jgi:hypothetical protein